MAKVVKLAQPGFDVKTAGDENLIYNSNWPLLKIYKQGSFTTSDFKTLGNIVVNHDLGYVPLFWYFANTTTDGYLGGTANTIDENRSEFFGPTYLNPTISDKALLFEGGSGVGATGSIKFYYYIFALDITTPFLAPIIKVGGQSGGHSTDKVFKISKPGKSISSPRLEDYVVNSNARSPLVHAVFPGTTVADSSVAGYGFSYYHNLGYPPMFFALVKSGGFYGVDGATDNSWALLPTSGTTSGFTVDEKKIAYSNFNANEHVSIIVLKDPFTIDYSVQVNI